MTTMDAPVGERERLDYLDILRGLAVLAIFVVNIKAMFAPFPYYMNATLWPGEFDMTVAAIQAFLVEDKWRTIFTALFGAGLALIAERSAARGAGSLALLSRRLFFLALFGLFHLLCIWGGDILFPYAVSGFLAMWFRRAGAKTLIRWSIGCLAVAVLWNAAFAIGPAVIPEVRAEVEPMLWGSDPAFLQSETESMLGSIGAQFEARLKSASEFILLYMFAGGFWLTTLGIMLAGMWGYRTGFLTGAAPSGTYKRTAVIGLGTAFAFDVIRWTVINVSGWDFAAFSYVQILNQLDGFAGAIGYAGLVGWLVRSGWRPKAVAATGRMAFTNYIACSLIGTTLANGHGFGLFGSLTNLQLMLIVFAVWTAILIWSPLWLARFRFGPLEWLWRSLTYGKIQTFRQEATEVRAA